MKHEATKGDHIITVKIVYKTSDGKTFDSYIESKEHEANLPSAFETAMNNRSWLRKLFNLKPILKRKA